MITTAAVCDVATHGRNDSLDDWLALARQGSVSALGHVLNSQRGPLLTLARRGLDARLQAKVGAEDLVQETFVQAQKDFEQFRGGSYHEFSSWLRSILANRLANSVRHYRHTKQRTIDRELSHTAAASRLRVVCDDVSGPNATLIQRDEQQRMRLALSRLSLEQRTVLLEHTCQGLSFARIAERHHNSPKQARLAWHRAVRKLGRLLTGID